VSVISLRRPLSSFRTLSRNGCRTGGGGGGVGGGGVLSLLLINLSRGHVLNAPSLPAAHWRHTKGHLRTPSYANSHT
jgi:hypothetical protein